MLNKKIVLIIVSFAMFMEAVDTTIINTAIPAIARSLAVNPIDLKIALISYLVSLAIFIPISGWMADKYGIKKVFITAVFIFTLSSFWCGFAHNLGELVIARTLQGIGGSMTVPVGRLIILRTFERHEIISKMSHVIMIAAIGMMLGPMLGGIITHQFSWPWIFWVNIPVGLFIMITSIIWLPDTQPMPVHPLDKLGFISFGSGLACFIFGFSIFSESNREQDQLGFFVLLLAVGLLLYYAWHSWRRPNPVLKTELLLYRTFRISVVGNLIARTAFGGLPFLLPLLLQIGLDYPADLSGFLLAPIALGVLFLKPFSLPILRHLGFKNLLILNTGLVALSLCAFATITLKTSVFLIGCYSFFYGFLISLQYTGMNSLAYAEIPPEKLSAATSIMGTVQQLSQSFGVAVCALLVRFFSSDITSGFNLTVSVFHDAFLGMALMTLLSTIIFLRLKPNDGAAMIRAENV